jgi:hypothetical protein
MEVFNKAGTFYPRRLQFLLVPCLAARTRNGRGHCVLEVAVRVVLITPLPNPSPQVGGSRKMFMLRAGPRSQAYDLSRVRVATLRYRVKTPLALDSVYLLPFAVSTQVRRTSATLQA